MRVPVLLALLALAGCTTVPSRFNDDTNLDCGYVLEAETADTLRIEVAYREYSFMSFPDRAIQSSRACFRQTADILASRRGKTATVGDLSTIVHRNEIDANYLVYVSGTVALK